MSLAKPLADKLKATGLSPAQAAAKAGITAVTFKAVLAGKSVPNKRSLGKYAKFLGMDLAEATALAGSRAKSGGKKAKAAGKKSGGKKAGRPAKAKKAGKRGRPAKAKKAGRTAKAAGVAKGKLKAVSKQVARVQKVVAKLAAVIAKLG